MPDISVCIVSLNTASFLKSCLDSLLISQDVSKEIIVVDNASTDSTLEMLVRDYPQVRLICNDTNRGYTAAMNQALHAGSGRYLMQLNPDTVIQADGFGRLITFMDENPEAGITTPKIVNADGSLQMQCRRSAARPWDVVTYFTGLSRLFPQSRLFGRYLMPWAAEDETFEVEAVSGSCMLVRREVFDNTGYLDEEFFAYQEDTDICFRARQKGWKVYYVPLGKVMHYGGLGGSRHQPFQAILAWHQSYYRYYQKHLARENMFFINWLMYIGMVGKLAASLIVNLVRSNKIVGTPKPGVKEYSGEK